MKLKAMLRRQGLAFLTHIKSLEKAPDDMVKRKQWRASPGINGLEGARMLVF